MYMTSDIFIIFTYPLPSYRNSCFEIATSLPSTETETLVIGFSINNFLSGLRDEMQFLKRA